MLLDRLVHERLRHRGIVHFAMAMTAVSDQVHYHVGAKLVAIFRRDARDPHHRVHIFAVHVEDRNRLPPRQLGGESRRVLVAGVGRKP